MKIATPNELLLPLTVVFGCAAIAAGGMRLLLLWASTRLSFAAGADLSISIYQRTLYQPYSVHTARNSSEVISGISAKSNSVIYNGILPVLTLISACFMLIGIVAALVSVEPLVTLMTFGGLGLIYASIIRLTRNRLTIDSECIARESTNVIKSLQEGLGGIRDVLLDGSQMAYCQIYRKSDLPLRRAQGNWQVIGASPRFGMEALGMLLIAMLAYTYAKEPGGVVSGIPILGALALGAQRLLPILQQAYAAWSGIRGGQSSLHDALVLLDQPLPLYIGEAPAEPVTFEQSIKLADVSFRYTKEGPWVLKNLALNIKKGSTIGFIGSTGSGKSTLLDIIMGLLSTTEGTLEIDGLPVNDENHRSWQTHVAHVPQTIFLADNTIAENIAFGVPHGEIDFDRVHQVACQAQIGEAIESWPGGYQALVGERGVRLSGGQRQRIGIARALYKGADVIIFDEATSALDSETEEAVMQSIDSLDSDLTVLIIAHRLSTLRNCQQIVELGDCGIRRIGTYSDIVNSNVSSIEVSE
jgi:ATP-binding cassette subfamily B protein